MSCCVPSCTIPTCVPSCSPSTCYPVGGLGSLSSCGGGSSGGGGISYSGPAASSSLGILRGAAVGCVTQAPPSEVVIQPSCYTVTIPGPVLSASCDPVSVGGYSACSSGGGGYGIGGGFGGGSGLGVCGTPYAVAGAGRLGTCRRAPVPKVCYSPC